MSYSLFLAVTATLFIRPSEVFEPLRTVPVYNILILACAAASLGPLLNLIAGRTLKLLPSAPCMLVILGTIISSSVLRGDLWTARHLGFEYAKLILYVLLLLANVDTPTRFASFLFWLLLFTTLLTGLAVLHYHGLIQIPNLEMLVRSDEVDPSTGENIHVIQLVATGIFGDPNDLCAALAVSTLIALSRLTDTGRGLSRILWMLPIAVFLYAIVLTQSRGGLLALLAGLLTVCLSRFGWKRTAPFFAIGLTGLLVISGGRQLRLSTGEETAQGRMALWVEGVRLLARTPLFGIGAGQYGEEAGLVAHNSFIHANVELGILGGTCFLGLFSLPGVAISRLSAGGDHAIDQRLRKLRPFVLGIIVSYAVGLCSISRCYIVTTYIYYGVALSYLHIAGAADLEGSTKHRWRPMAYVLLVDLIVLAATLLVLPRFLDAAGAS